MSGTWCSIRNPSIGHDTGRLYNWWFSADAILVKWLNKDDVYTLVFYRLSRVWVVSWDFSLYPHTDSNFLLSWWVFFVKFRKIQRIDNLFKTKIRGLLTLKFSNQVYFHIMTNWDNFLALLALFRPVKESLHI